MSDAEAARHARVKALFDAALDLTARSRRALLDEASRSQPEVAREVEALLDAHCAAATDFLSRRTSATDAIGNELESLGRDRGWHVLRELGRDGMGVDARGQAYFLRARIAHAAGDTAAARRDAEAALAAAREAGGHERANEAEISAFLAGLPPAPSS